MKKVTPLQSLYQGLIRCKVKFNTVDKSDRPPMPLKNFRGFRSTKWARRKCECGTMHLA